MRAPVAGHRRTHCLANARKHVCVLTFPAGLTRGGQLPRTRTRIQASPNRVHQSHALEAPGALSARHPSKTRSAMIKLAAADLGIDPAHD